MTGSDDRRSDGAVRRYVDSYVSNPDWRDGSRGLDGDQVRERARVASARLRGD